jgi:hypothetical protein
MWECRCDCGRLAERTTATLNVTRRRGGKSCCNVCGWELMGGHLHETRDKRRQGYRHLWQTQGTLYSESATAYLVEKVAEDLQREFGYILTDDNETWARQQVRKHGHLSVCIGEQWTPPSYYDGPGDVGDYQAPPKPEPVTARPELRRVAGPSKEYRETIERMRGWLALQRDKDRRAELGELEKREREMDAFLRSLWESDGPIIIRGSIIRKKEQP